MYKLAFLGIVALFAGTVACSSGESSDAGETEGAVSAKHCGGFAGLSCSDNEYCHYEENEQCGATDRLGTCKVKPQICTEEYAPVCGCDGKTYSNSCNAWGSGTSVARHGECEGQPAGGVPPQPQKRACGGFAGLQCGDKEFCNYKVEEMCGAADHTGTCEPIPELCYELYAPVCGCDGKTYPNNCYANRASVAVFKEGVCVQQ